MFYRLAGYTIYIIYTNPYTYVDIKFVSETAEVNYKKKYVLIRFTINPHPDLLVLRPKELSPGTSAMKKGLIEFLT